MPVLSQRRGHSIGMVTYSTHPIFGEATSRASRRVQQPCTWAEGSPPAYREQAGHLSSPIERCRARRPRRVLHERARKGMNNEIAIHIRCYSSGPVGSRVVGRSGGQCSRSAIARHARTGLASGIRMAHVRRKRRRNWWVGRKRRLGIIRRIDRISRPFGEGCDMAL